MTKNNCENPSKKKPSLIDIIDLFPVTGMFDALNRADKRSEYRNNNASDEDLFNNQRVKKLKSESVLDTVYVSGIVLLYFAYFIGGYIYYS